MECQKSVCTKLGRCMCFICTKGGYFELLSILRCKMCSAPFYGKLVWVKASPMIIFLKFSKVDVVKGWNGRFAQFQLFNTFHTHYYRTCSIACRSTGKRHCNFFSWISQKQIIPHHPLLMHINNNIVSTFAQKMTKLYNKKNIQFCCQTFYILAQLVCY